MLVTSVLVTLLSVALMFGGDEPFLREKIKPMLQRECASNKAVEIAFDNMYEISRSHNTTELTYLFDANQTKVVCTRATPLFDSIGSFIVATKPCLNGTEKSKIYSLVELNKKIWGLVCSDDLKSTVKCYEEKVDYMAKCFLGFQGVNTRSSEERTEACKEFKADMECSLKIFKECSSSNVVDIAEQFIEYLLDETVCWEFALAQTQWMHETGLISTETPII